MSGLPRLAFFALILVLLGVLSSCACSCAGEPTAIELQVSSQLFTQAGDLSLTAKTWGPVARVAFFDENTKLGEDDTAPYTQIVSLTKAHNGNRTYRSVALDSSGQAMVSFAVQVQVAIP